MTTSLTGKNGGSALEKLLDFLAAAGRLKRIPRTGWVESGIDDPESVADHSFRTAITAMLLSDLQGLDTERAIRMALLHDLVEAEIGDLTPEQKELRGSGYLKEEKEAMEGLLSTLPEELSSRYVALWEELRNGVSREAEAVAQADRVEMLLQALEYEEAGADPKALERFWQAQSVDGLPSVLLEAIKKRNRKC